MQPQEIELGVDIPDMSCYLSIGYPGSITSVHQQFGRVGRVGEGWGIVILHDDPLEQYFARFPKEFFDKKPEDITRARCIVEKLQSNRRRNRQIHLQICRRTRKASQKSINFNHPFFKYPIKEKGNMANMVEKEIENFKKCIEIYGRKTLHSLLSAFLIWLFGVLVFIPLARSLNRQAEVFCTLIFFIAFTLLTLRVIPGLKKLIDVFLFFPARKCGLKKGLSHENLVILFRHLFYIVLIVIFYLLYFPFLANFNPSISGIVLILALIWIFFLILELLPVFTAKMFEWLSSKE